MANDAAKSDLRPATAKQWNAERQYMENLFSQRLAATLVFFSITVTGAVLARSTSVQLTVLISGLLVLVLMLFPLLRCNSRIGVAMDELRQFTGHPASVTAAKLEPGIWHTFGVKSARPLVGVGLPLVMPAIITVLIGLSITGVIRPSDAHRPCPSCESASRVDAEATSTRSPEDED